MDASPLDRRTIRRARPVAAWSRHGLLGLLLGLGALLPACTSNDDAVGPTFPAKVTGDGIGGPTITSTVAVQVTVNPGSIDQGRRGSVLVIVTNLNGIPLGGRTVQLTSSAGRLDQTTGVTDSAGLFATTIFIPCEVAVGTYTVTAIVDGTVSLPAPFTVVTALTNDPCS
jgi:hypothetical protein